MVKSGTSSLGKVWKNSLLNEGVTIDQKPLRNLCKEFVSIFEYISPDLPVLLTILALPKVYCSRSSNVDFVVGVNSDLN